MSHHKILTFTKEVPSFEEGVVYDWDEELKSIPEGYIIQSVSAVSSTMYLSGIKTWNNQSKEADYDILTLTVFLSK